MSKTIGIVLALQDKCSPQLKKIADKIGVTEKQMKNARRTMQKGVQTMNSGFKEVGSVVGIASAAVVSGMGVCVHAASELNETVNKIDVSFGKNANSVKAWAKTSIKQMGLAQQSALDNAALYGDMATGMGMSQKEAAKVSTSLTQLGADLASFKNISNEQAKIALASVFTGETESLKELGIVMTETNLQQYGLRIGMLKAIETNHKTHKMKMEQVKDLTQTEQIMLRYKYVMEMTKNAQGDFVRTGGGFANQSRIFGEQIKEISTTLGEYILPQINKSLIQINSTIISNMPLIKASIIPIFTIFASGIQLVIQHLGVAIPILAGAVTAFTAFHVISGIVTVVKGFQMAIKGVTVAQGIWNAIMLANPIGAVAVAIGGLVALLVAVATHWREITHATQSAIRAAKNYFHIKDNSVDLKNRPMEMRSLPHHASGTGFSSGGAAVVGEYEPEIVNLPHGASVLSGSQTKKALGSTVYITVKVNGNVIGNKKFIDDLCNTLGYRFSKAMAV
jgi:hypothetical protein